VIGSIESVPSESENLNQKAWLYRYNVWRQSGSARWQMWKTESTWVACA